MNRKSNRKTRNRFNDVYLQVSATVKLWPLEGRAGTLKTRDGYSQVDTRVHGSRVRPVRSQDDPGTTSTSGEGKEGTKEVLRARRRVQGWKELRRFCEL